MSERSEPNLMSEEIVSLQHRTNAKNTYFGKLYKIIFLSDLKKILKYIYSKFCKLLFNLFGVFRQRVLLLQNTK